MGPSRIVRNQMKQQVQQRHSHGCGDEVLQPTSKSARLYESERRYGDMVVV